MFQTNYFMGTLLLSRQNSCRINFKHHPGFHNIILHSWLHNGVDEEIYIKLFISYNSLKQTNISYRHLHLEVLRQILHFTVRATQKNGN